ncbi:hypothetical protein X798_08149 [Onchocerca flexuosa]|uniref:Uncharacterized protein n=1 Tax=Onchocerca flexuosa TaxID=387005 RepID=A0A238BHD2_9BILA|nr:hypothetical protein X798_08149 [Onchocerca flexuosa]
MLINDPNLDTTLELVYGTNLLFQVENKRNTMMVTYRETMDRLEESFRSNQDPSFASGAYIFHLSWFLSTS